MATGTAATSIPPGHEPQRSRLPFLIVAGVIVLVIVAVGIWLLAGDDDSSSSSKPEGASPSTEAKALYSAWQSNAKAAAAKVATPAAVTSIFAIPINEGTGLVFGGCAKSGTAQLPQTCTFSRPGGELKMTVSKVGDDQTITAVTLGPAATTPTG